MGWVNDARKELAAGRQVHVRPSGGSMRGRIESGQRVTLAPVDPSTAARLPWVVSLWLRGAPVGRGIDLDGTIRTGDGQSAAVRGKRDGGHLCSLGEVQEFSSRAG